MDKRNRRIRGLSDRGDDFKMNVNETSTAWKSFIETLKNIFSHVNITYTGADDLIHIDIAISDTNQLIAKSRNIIDVTSEQ